jgi:HD-GYP domain-containing protein (c-di-GMP phosphodiesterase class II)
MLQMVSLEKNWADIICPIDFGGGQRLGRLSGAPLTKGEMADNAVLLVWDDLTEVITAQKKREKSLEDLTSLLTGLIDARDRYSATQGAQIAELSGPISAALDYDNETRHLLDLSAKLLNLGKVLVPPEILTKAGKLDPEELKIVQDAKAKTAELLKDIDFDVPVLSVIEEAGSKDADISGPAGALRVMNDFVSMVSPRAHRKALDVDEALKVLKERADYYDASAVSALAHVLENKGGRKLVSKWQSAEKPKVLPAL